MGRPAAPVTAGRPIPGPAERSLYHLALGGAGCLGLFLALVVLIILAAAAQSFPILIVSTVMAVLPVPVYALVIVSLDRHVREPVGMLVSAFFWGAVVATLFAFIITSGVIVLVSAFSHGVTTLFTMPLDYSQLTQGLVPSLVAPVVEETSKGLVLLLIFFFVRYELNDVVDGIVLGALVGLGFAMTENVQYFAQQYAAGAFTDVTAFFFVRTIVGGFGHSLFTATTGAGLGLAEETGSPAVRRAAPFAGYCTAIFLHSAVNTTNGILERAQVSNVILVAATVLVLLAPGILTLLGITFFAWRRETRVITDQLREEVDRGVVRSGEYALLSSDRERARRVWHVLFAYGPRAWYLVRQLYNTEVALAFRKWHTARGERLPAFQRALNEDAYRQHIPALRQRLAAMGVPTE